MKKNLKRVVFIENDGCLREKYSQVLENNGFDVHQICDGREACLCMRKAQDSGDFPDLVIMAILLPGMDGFEILEKVNKNEMCQLVPKIVFTELDNKKDRQTAFSLGVEDYLIKDNTTPEQLVDIALKITSKKE